MFMHRDYINFLILLHQKLKVILLQNYLPSKKLYILSVNIKYTINYKKNKKFSQKKTQKSLVKRKNYGHGNESGLKLKEKKMS